MNSSQQQTKKPQSSYPDDAMPRQGETDHRLLVQEMALPGPVDDGYTAPHLPKTAVRLSETHQTFLLKLSDALRPLVDAVEVQYMAARMLGEYVGANRVGYAEDQGDGEHVTVARNYVDGVPGIEGRYTYNDYGPVLVRSLRAGRTVIRSDIPNDPTLTQAEKDAHAVLALGATVNVPLVKRGQLMGIFFVHSVAARGWTDDEVALFEEVAERTWAAVVRARAEDALRQSEQQYRTLFESIAEGFCIIEVTFNEQGQGVDYQFLEVNPAFERHTGLVDNDGLAEALGWLANQMKEQHGLAVDVEVTDDVPAPGEDLRLLLFQVVRELLFNVVKHAGILDATVFLSRRNGCLRVEVSDQGIGFDARAVTDDLIGSHGLAHTRQRLALVGGEMQIESASGYGTRIVIECPIRGANNAFPA